MLRSRGCSRPVAVCEEGRLVGGAGHAYEVLRTVYIRQQTKAGAGDVIGAKVRSARLRIPSSANALPAIGEPKRPGGKTLVTFGGTVPVKLLHNHARSLQHLVARVHSECTV
jgi:hypothetical protein